MFSANDANIPGYRTAVGQIFTAAVDATLTNFGFLEDRDLQPAPLSVSPVAAYLYHWDPNCFKPVGTPLYASTPTLYTPSDPRPFVLHFSRAPANAHAQLIMSGGGSQYIIFLSSSDFFPAGPIGQILGAVATFTTATPPNIADIYPGGQEVDI
ncbi:hypothetical protein WJX75_004324 [Coccomyxa subellipsoidea]|uniref:Uncharacterized protein n=1 Tax=Coccomyxa subellipsoidea TaxID=248742 RepID=A0ABR2YKA2_9CHLO